MNNTAACNSPALRRADMGIPMAITGSEVSREAASLVLLDDNFTSVVEGIRRGRIIFASMKKVRQMTIINMKAHVTLLCRSRNMFRLLCAAIALVSAFMSL
jgi:magnesium-transporting ATPase (P-type)